MKRMLAGALLALPILAMPALAEIHEGFLPWPIHRQELSNGLEVMVIPTPEFADVLSYNTLVLAGARNEIEPGKSGLAHLFEHILFRHMKGGEVGGYDEAIGALGAFNNAWTWFDVTFYHPTTFASNLDALARLESERFTDLAFNEKLFRTEAGAVLGEYRNNASNPGQRMSEQRLEWMYGSHGYGHTTIGYLDDVEDMPNEYEAALRFYDDYYRPNSCVLLVTGDVEPATVFELAEELYGSWEAKPQPELPTAPALNGPERQHIDWSVDVPPRVSVAWQAPEAFSTSSPLSAALQLIPEILTSETSDLYRELRSEKQLVSSLWLSTTAAESFDKGPVVLSATVYKDKFGESGESLLGEIENSMREGANALKNFSAQKDAAATLEALKAKYRYDLLAQLGNPADIASTLSWYYRFGREIDALDRLVAAVDALQPADIDRAATALFIPQTEITVTLSCKSEATEETR